MDILRNLFGSVVRLLVTVGILAAAYFFIVRPVLDTTETISSEANDSIRRSFENSGFDEIDVTLENVNKRVERQLQQSLKASKRHGDVDKLRRCMKKAVGDVDAVRRCAAKY